LFLYNYCYELTITGLLEIKLIGYLLRNGCHLLQQLRILLVCTVGGYQWGLGYDSQRVPGYDSQRVPPLCPTRLRRPDQRAP
jgi:hypothetical protein